MLKNILVLASLSFAGMAFCATPQLLPSSDGAKVDFTAQAQVTVPNDLATLVFSASAESKELKDAQAKVNTLMQEAEKALMDFRSKAQFKTLNYSVRPIYSEQTKGNRGITSWEATQRLQLTTTEIQEVPTIAQKAQSAGLGLSSVNYSLTNGTLSKTNEALTQDVINNVNAKASEIAKAMGLPFESFSVETIKFEEENNLIGTPLLLSARAMPRVAEEVPLPSFDSGTSDVHKTARVTLKVVAPQK